MVKKPAPSGKITSKQGPWGSWGESVRCNSSHVIFGARAKSQRKMGSFYDDTAGRSIERSSCSLIKHLPVLPWYLRETIRWITEGYILAKIIIPRSHIETMAKPCHVHFTNRWHLPCMESVRALEIGVGWLALANQSVICYTFSGLKIQLPQ